LILGLDFGTSTTSVSELDSSGEVTLLKIGFQGAESIPSLVAESPSGEIFFGQDAKAQFQINPDVLLKKSFKNFISHQPDIHSSEVEDKLIAAFLTYVFENVAKKTQFNLFRDKSIQLRVSCPAGWNWQQRSRLLRIISQDLGFSVANSEVVDEPSAAGVNFLSYLYSENARKRTLVFDMGGGTLDIAVLETAGEKIPPTIKSASSEAIAGNKLDEVLTERLLRIAAQKVAGEVYASDFSSEQLAQKLVGSLGLSEKSVDDVIRWIAFRLEDLKKSDLAQEQDAVIPKFLGFLKQRFTNLEFDNSLDFRVELNSDDFEKTVYAFLDETKPLVLRVVQDSLFTGKNIHELPRIGWVEAIESLDHVVLAGGMAHVGALRNWIDDNFPGKRLDLYVLEPEHLVAAGLAPRTVLEKDFVAESKFRPNFHLALGSFIFLYAYTPLFSISPGQFDGLAKKVNPVADGWVPQEDVTEIRRLTLSSEEIPSTDRLFFSEGDLAPFRRDGFTVYPDGRLVGMDGVGKPINWNIFTGSNVERDRSISRGCSSCGRGGCSGSCSN
jgi:molecular chaperone DnaK (HSP70)